MVDNKKRIAGTFIGAIAGVCGIVSGIKAYKDASHVVDLQLEERGRIPDTLPKPLWREEHSCDSDGSS